GVVGGDGGPGAAPRPRRRHRRRHRHRRARVGRLRAHHALARAPDRPRADGPAVAAPGAGLRALGRDHRRRPRRARRRPAGAGVARLRRAVPFGLLMAGFALYYRVDMVMLEWLAAPGELGRYAAAYRFLDAVIALAASLGGPLFPRLSSVAISAPGEARRLLEAGWRPLLALGLPLTVGTMAVAGDLVALLFGP